LKFLARQKLRYDLGAGFVSIATFAAALLAASDKIAYALSLSSTVVMIFGVPALVFAVWFLGYVLDRGKFYDAYQDETNARNAKLMAAIKK